LGYPRHSLTCRAQRWVVLVARDLMKRHTHVTAVDMDMTRLPWERLVVDGKPHNHAFIRGVGSRFVRAHVPRTGPVKLVAGFRGVRVMKTTQSGFEGYIVDEFTTLKPTRDRIMATEISCEYAFEAGTDLEGTPFAAIADAVRAMTLERFAGPADTGVYSASVQQTVHQIGLAVLERFPVVASITFALPNIHFYAVDFADYKGSGLTNDKEVFYTFDGAHGQIEATIQRKPQAKL
jgi:urate oxidase